MAARLINGRYHVLRRLGEGAQGAVFLVEDRVSAERRALKVIHHLDAASTATAAAEFRVLADLDHPHLIEVYDLDTVTSPVPGIAAGSVFFTCKYAAGETITTACQRHPESERSAFLVTVATQIASALGQVHAAGLLHRDIKPSNVLVDLAENGPVACLLDFGLAGRRHSPVQVRGTLEYMPMESLAGHPEPTSDLYSLGATLFEAATQRPPIGGANTAELVANLLEGNRAPVAGLAPWLEPAVAGFIDRLLQHRPEDRPASVATVLDDLDRIRDELGLPAVISHRARLRRLLPPALVGRDLEINTVVGAMGRAADRSAPRLVRVVGAPGTGRSALVERAVRTYQLLAAAGRAPATEILRGSMEQLAGALGVDDSMLSGSTHQVSRFVDRFVDGLARASRGQPTVVVVDDPDDARSHHVARAVAAGHRSVAKSQVVLIVVENGDQLWPSSAMRATTVEIPVLGRDDIAELARSMIGRDLGGESLDIVLRQSGGLPSVAVDLLHLAMDRGDLDKGQLAVPEEGRHGALTGRRLAALPQTLYSLAAACAIHRTPVSVAVLASTLDVDDATIEVGLAELEARGVMTTVDGVTWLRSQHQAREIERALEPAHKSTLHRAALSAITDGESEARARHLLAVGDRDLACATARRAAAALERRGRMDDAIELCETALGLATGDLRHELAVDLGELQAAIGDYSDALANVHSATAATTAAIRQRAQLAHARVCRKSGATSDAVTTLEALIKLAPRSTAARAIYARALVSVSRFEDAEAQAEHVLSLDPAVDDRALAREAAGLAALYRGHLDRAQTMFAALESVARSSGRDAMLGRALGLRGMAAQAEGNIAGAAALYRDAGEAARRGSDIHSAAVYDLNQATALCERGRFGHAVAALDSALIEFTRLGDVGELAAAYYNRGLALLGLGELAAAERASRESRRLADEQHNEQMRVYGRLLAGDLARRRGDIEGATASYREAASIAAAAELARDRDACERNLAEVLAAAGDREAVDLGRAVSERAHSADEQRRAALTCGRVAVDLGLDIARAMDRLDGVGDAAEQAGQDDLGWRCHVLVARMAVAVGALDRARQAASDGRRLFASIEADTPEARRPGLRDDTDHQGLIAIESQLEPARRPPAAAPRAATDSGNLRRLLAVSRRLNSELRLAPLLDEVIDAAIELTHAERGFLLLEQPKTGALDIVVARNIDQSSMTDDEARLSRSIAERSARRGDVVLTIDAAFDDRWGDAASVAAMQLRSVLAVPLRQKTRTIGTIYVDHRLRRGAFDDDAVEMVRELADIAAVAIENARLTEDNQRRQREIAELNERLEQEVVDKEAELVNVRARLSTVSATLKHPYDAIIGRSPVMVEMLSMVDRATDTALPVVIFGESGTGKELVARALHMNGGRKKRPFVAINCGAVPEQLLESELFGHVRGAFTGADRDRRGLFEVADQGTLFLDEVGDTSLAMQGKLLRVLQEGEIRRVGDERARTVDVRIIAASNKRLSTLVESGAFRQDLFYRMHVLSIDVPPLRSRLEDVAALSRHILERSHKGGSAPVLDKTALNRLAAHHWPGNVRELENELARASAMADDRIRVEHLSKHLAALAESPVLDADSDLRLKPRIEALERTLLEEALSKTHGNQSKAARLLGLSRYGLQKKLKRLELDDRDW